MAVRIVGRKAEVAVDKTRVRSVHREVTRHIADDTLLQVCDWRCEVVFVDDLTKTVDWICRNLHYFNPDRYAQ
jgi:hypothetical protein